MRARAKLCMLYFETPGLHVVQRPSGAVLVISVLFCCCCLGSQLMLVSWFDCAAPRVQPCLACACSHAVTQTHVDIP